MLRKLGDRLTLVGVGHVLPESRAEVESVITQERPEVVAVELCHSRYAVLINEIEQVGAKETLHVESPKPLTLGWLFHLLQTRFARRTGMPAGEEMLAAIRCAREVGAKVELIDRDINLTLQRLAERMGTKEKLRLFLELILGFLPFGARVDIERLTEDEVVARLLSSLKGALPTAYEVLIEERNSYMAASILWLLAKGREKIVCVVGAGHVPGLVQRLGVQVEGGWRAALKYQSGMAAGD